MCLKTKSLQASEKWLTLPVSRSTHLQLSWIVVAGTKRAHTFCKSGTLNESFQADVHPA